MRVIVGLGNPGKRYEGTRHNVGFEVIEQLAGHHGVALKEKKFKALFGRGYVHGEAVMLVCPQTFMNRSGESVGPLVGFYKLGVESVVVVHDDLDLPLGAVKVKSGGGHGGHNGLRDLVSKLGSADFHRIRVGIGRPQGSMATSDWVLSRWAVSQREQLQRIRERASEAIEHLLLQGPLEAMNHFNGMEPVET